MSKPAVGFVGLGAMGFGMATHLVKEGYPVHGYDIFSASVQRFKGTGGIPAASLKESATDKAFYIYLPPNATVLLCSTVSSSYVQCVAREIESRGRSDIFFIDCPVSGGAKRAGDGTLSIMAGATDRALQSGSFLLHALSSAEKMYLVPGGIGSGSKMKMVHQMLAGIHVLGASEAMGFAAHLGLDARKTATAIMKSDAWTWMHENRFPRMVDEDWNPGASALTIILKDIGIITTSAREAHFPTPLCCPAEQLYLSALLQAWGAKDDSAMVRQYFPQPLTSIPGFMNNDESEALQLVLDLMCKFYGLTCEAAGASQQFIKNGVVMIEGKPGNKSQTVDKIVSQLEAVAQRARDLHCPLHLGNAALNQLLFAQRAGLGGEASTNVIKIWH